MTLDKEARVFLKIRKEIEGKRLPLCPVFYSVTHSSTAGENQSSRAQHFSNIAYADYLGTLLTCSLLCRCGAEPRTLHF